MLDSRILRAGAGAAMAGAVIGLIFNLLHPRTSEYDDVQAELELVAGSDIWVLDHYMLAWSVALGLIALIAIGWSFPDQPAASWARMGLGFGIASSAIALALIVVDGTAMKDAADNWQANGGDAALAAGEAVARVSLALLTAGMGSFFGITPLIFGIAMLTSVAYPKWLGWVAVVAGALGLLAASIQYLAGPSALTLNVLFTAGSLLLTIWFFATGYFLWQRTSGAATTETITTTP